MIRLAVILFLSYCQCGVAALSQFDDQAETPTPFGLKYYHSSQLNAGLPASILYSAPNAKLWQQQVEEAEWSGPYNPLLIETLSGQAEYLLERGDVDGAIRSFQRAVHVTRINEGLQSKLQIPLVRKLYQAFLADSDKLQADNTQSYLYFISRRASPSGSNQRVEAALEYLDWQRQAWLVKLDGKNDERLYRAIKLSDDLLDGFLLRVDAPLGLYTDLVLMRLKLWYLLEQGRFGEQDNYRGALNRGFNNQLDWQLSIEERQLQVWQRGVYARGQRDIELLLASLAIPVDRAPVLIALGDWHLWHDHELRAQAAYRQAWTETPDSQQAQLYDRFFSKPAELPANGIYFSPLEPGDESARQVSVTAEFKVSKRGRATAIEVRAVDAAFQGAANRLARWLRRAKYRPQMIEGELVATERVRRRYTVLQ